MGLNRVTFVNQPCGNSIRIIIGISIRIIVSIFTKMMIVGACRNEAIIYVPKDKEVVSKTRSDNKIDNTYISKDLRNARLLISPS